MLVVVFVMQIPKLTAVSSFIEKNVPAATQSFVLLGIAAGIAYLAFISKKREQFAALAFAVVALEFADQRLRLGLGVLSRIENAEMRTWAVIGLIVIALLLMFSKWRIE